ncbi:hypothetical protein ACQW5G_02175 [Fructilactobacillus sp. Tb1]|uniref:hypothetical protein n=1 Tax=Fructilactobacillus sp. Tb1 TaxID=3422304 RepID=UPI003D2D2C04
MSDNLSFNDLNEQAQTKAINGFMPFYGKLLSENALDVMTTFDFDHVMADINRSLKDVSNKTTDEMYAFVIKFHADAIKDLVNELPQTYFDNGNPMTDWSQWYVEETNKLDPDATL